MLRILLVDENDKPSSTVLPFSIKSHTHKNNDKSTGPQKPDTMSFCWADKDKVMQLEFSHVRASINSSPDDVSCMQISLQPLEVSLSSASQIQVGSPILLLKAIKFLSEIISIYENGEIFKLRNLLANSEKEARSIIDDATSLHPEILRFKHVFEYIENNYNRPISLKDVAKSVGYSPAYLTNTIHRYTGYSVNHWILKRRMDEAHKLLRETNLSVEKIADLVGYRSKSHFFRQFQKLYSVSPQIWRKCERSSSPTTHFSEN